MPTLTIEAVPATPGRPSHIKINGDLNAAEAVMLLERTKALLLQQPVAALDGEPQAVELASGPGLRQMLNGRGG